MERMDVCCRDVERAQKARVVFEVQRARNARTIYDAQRAGAEFSAHRGTLPARPPTLTVSRSAIPVVRVEGDTLTFPVVAFVEGVRQPANSEGPELFLASEFSRALDSALSMPVVFQHPTKDGGRRYVSINEPPFDSGTGVPVGFVTAAEFDAKRLVVQVVAWFSKLRQAGPEAEALGEAILRGDQVEVSIGHYSRMFPEVGRYNGEAFSGVHTDVVFDHLALLPLGTPAACGWADGCGTPRV